MFRNKEKYHVYITNNTLRGMILEVGRHPNNESIIQMPGIRIGNNFYFDMLADSGIHATYTPTMCEKDYEYTDHLSTRIAENYDFSKGKMTVSQVHRHPDNCLKFSAGDYPANSKLAKRYGGVVNGLMFVDPEFRVKFWYIDEDGREIEADYEVNDKMVAEAMPLVDIDRLRSAVEKNEAKRNEAERNSTKGKEDIKEDSNVNIDFEKVKEELMPYKVLIPAEYRDESYEGTLMGYYIPETKTYNIIRSSANGIMRDGMVRLGAACSADHALRKRENTDFSEVYIIWYDDEPVVFIGSEKKVNVDIEYYSEIKDIFSRNKGIVAMDTIRKKQAVIAGMGSGGFKIGIELVRAGIGSLIVADDDIVSYHNVCRHECGIHDVGRYKVDCFKEKAADINPNCVVYTYRELIQHVDPELLKENIWKDSVIISCADNRHCGYICNKISDTYNIPMIDAGCGPRASTGEVFYYKPDSGMACYTCTYGEDKGIDYSNQAVRRQFYATEKELEKVNFQPGMYLDIELVAIFTAKLAIDLLMETDEGYEMKILPYISQCTILLNYPIDKDVNPYMQIFGEEPSIKPLIWKSVSAKKNPKCDYCGNT